MRIEGRFPNFEVKNLVLLSMALLVVIRVIAWMNTAIVSRDSILYLALAKDWLTGTYLKALRHPYHPLYPMLIALISKGFGVSLERAAVGISIGANALTLPALAILFKRYMKARVVFLGLLFFCVSPFLIRYTADILSEPLYIFFVAWAAAFSAKVIDPMKPGDGKALWAFLGGLCVGFAYLTRPEGLVVGITAVLWSLSFRKNWPIKRILRFLFPLVVGGILIGTPYILYLHRDTGTWLLTRKKRVGTLIKKVKGKKVQKATPPSPEVHLPKGISKKRAEFLINRARMQRELADRIRQAFGNPKVALVKPGASFWQFLGVFLLSLGKVFLGFFKGMFLPIGLWVVFRFFCIKEIPWNRWDRFILIFTILYWIILGLLLSGYGYVSRRHYVPVGVFWFGWAAIGFTCACRSLASFLKPKLKSIGVRQVGAFLLIPIVGISVIKGSRPYRREKTGRKVVGQWILREKPRGKNCAVLTSMVRIGYYAGCRTIFIGIIAEKDVNALRRHEIPFVVLQKREMSASPDLMKLLKKFGYREVYHYTNPVGHQDLHVFSCLAKGKG